MVDRGGTTRQFAVAAGVALVLAVSGCAGASPSPTVSGGPSTSAAPTTSREPSSSPTPHEPGPGSWTAVQGVPEIGSGHTATRLRDGRVLVAGGVMGSSSDADWASAVLYDPTDGSWTPTRSMLQGRAAHTATLLPTGTVLVAGGYGLNDSPVSAELYDPQTGRWAPAGNMSEARSYHTATLLPDGNVLVSGGGLPSAALYDSASGTWRAAGGTVQARLSHTATPLPGGMVLVVGGETDCGFECHSPLASADLYDASDGSWTPAGPMATPRSYHTATLLADGTVLVAGGCCGTGYLEPIASGELFHPQTASWTAAPGMIEGRLGHTATLLLDGRVLVAGGGRGAAGSAELYDPASGTWAATGAMASPRAGETATLLADGRVLFVAASSGSGPASAQLYDPGT